MTQRPRITAFGSSRTDIDPSIAKDVHQLGQSLAEAGWDGMVGGYQGLMAAFCAGMRAGGGHVRGVTLACFPTPPTHRLSEEVRAQNFFERMGTLIEQADAYLVLPGGLGTLAELAMTWDLLAIHILRDRPLILYGARWRRLLDTLNETLFFSSPHAMDYVHCCDNAREALRCLRAP
ncbi:MAG: hypothetical protein D6678_07395 [Zetaproteobacteria bacterium]|nr:MAG: hypothetical protein D6678_07395 [Zetaproteobacteria bacterium]